MQCPRLVGLLTAAGAAWCKVAEQRSLTCLPLTNPLEDGLMPKSYKTPYPTDKELLELMPEAMRDEFSYAAKVCSEATGGQVKPRLFRVALNTAALEYAQAIIARWGQ